MQDSSEKTDNSKNEDEEELIIHDYLPEFNFNAPSSWDPFEVYNIFEVNGKFVIPKVFLKYFPLMAIKGGPGHVADGYYFVCNNRGRKSRAKHYRCDGDLCKYTISLEGWTKYLHHGNSENTCLIPKHLINRLFNWFLLKKLPNAGTAKTTDIIVKCLKGQPDSVLKEIDNNNIIIKFVSKQRHKSNPIRRSAKSINKLELTPEQKLLPDGS